MQETALGRKSECSLMLVPVRTARLAEEITRSRQHEPSPYQQELSAFSAVKGELHLLFVCKATDGVASTRPARFLDISGVFGLPNPHGNGFYRVARPNRPLG